MRPSPPHLPVPGRSLPPRARPSFPPAGKRLNAGSVLPQRPTPTRTPRRCGSCRSFARARPCRRGRLCHRAFHHAAQALHRRYAFVRYGTGRGRGYAGGCRAQGIRHTGHPRRHSGKAGADGLCPEKRQAAHSHQGRHQSGCGAAGGAYFSQLTAEWENRLTEIAKGQADPDEFMDGIETQARELVQTYSCISEEKQKLFQAERVPIGTCPRCGEAVYEGKKNYYCGNRACQFVMWKNDRFLRNARKRSPRRSPLRCSKPAKSR